MKKPKPIPRAFTKLCKLMGIDPTRRQYAKWKAGKGELFTKVYPSGPPERDCYGRHTNEELCQRCLKRVDCFHETHKELFL